MPCLYLLDCMPDLIRVQIHPLIIIFMVVIVMPMIVIVAAIVAMPSVVIPPMAVVPIISPVPATVGGAGAAVGTTPVLTDIARRLGLSYSGRAHNHRGEGSVAASSGYGLDRRVRQPLRLHLHSQHRWHLPLHASGPLGHLRGRGLRDHYVVRRLSSGV